MLINSSEDDDVLIVGKQKKMFNRRRFFTKLRDKTHERMREMLRYRVLSYPNISVSMLRWFIISQNRLTPISNLRLLKVERAPVQRRMIVEEAKILAYPNQAKFAFNGSAILLEASSTDLPNYFGSGEIGPDWFTRTYAQHSNERDIIMRKVEYDLALMRHWLGGQDQSIAWFNAWLERAVDRAIVYYADHIALWRQEGELDKARFNATIKPVRKAAAARSKKAA